MKPRSTVAPLLTGLFLTVAVVLAAAPPAAATPAYPRPDGRCVDHAGVLGPRLCAKVTKVLLRDEARTSDEIAVTVVPNTGKQTIEAWSTALFNAWGVGKKNKNNGVLLVVAVDDRRVRLETGPGMSARLSDEAAGEIVQTVIIPRFAEGAYAAGILAGLDEVRRRVGHDVPRDARLITLAATAPSPPAPAPATEETASTGDVVPAGDDVIIDGDPFTDDDFSGWAGADERDGFPGWILVPFVAGVALIVVIGAMRRASGSGGSSGAPHRSASTFHSRSTPNTFLTGSTTGSGWSTGGGGSSSSSDSGSSFGGGSSDGGGSSGSW